jgi:hypothetical protein
MRYWHRVSFWTKVKDSVQGILAITQLSLVIGDAQHVYNFITFAGQVVGLLIPIWMEDRNQNQIADVFEKEITVTVKSDSPVTTDIKTEIKP